MVTRKKVKVTSTPVRKTKRRTVEEEVDEVLEEETGSKKKTKVEGFDYLGLFNETLDEISKRQGVDTDLMEMVKPISTGYLMLDLVTGGIKPAFYGHAGFEQSCKTTGALEIMASAVKQKIPLISYWDFEGCVTENTYISHSRGKQTKLKDLFDLSEVNSWEPGSFPGQQRTDIDTVEPGHRYGGTGVRTGNLFYKGKKATTKVTFNTGHSLVGHGHKMYVLRNGYAAVVKMEDLKVGEHVLVNRKFLGEIPEEWSPVKGFGPVIAERYQVSTHGQVRSMDFDHVVTRTLRNGNTFDSYRTVQGRILNGNPVKDGHLWVALCDGDTQRKRLIHRIVARTFLGKAPKDKPLVLHWNDNPADNRLTNLRYGNDLDNAQDQVVRWRKAKGEQVHTATFTETQVREIRDLFEEGHDYKDLASMFKSSVRRIKAICNRTHWKYVSGSDDVPFEVTEEILNDYEVAAVTSVELTGKKEHVFDISLIGVARDHLPHSIITNGVVTHNSTANSIPYLQNILRSMGVKVPAKDIFGRKDHTTGKWIVRPTVRYNAETRGEAFFDWLAAVLRELPDKKYVANQWWLVFDENNKKHKAQVGDKADKTMNKKYGKGLWVPAPDSNLQGLVICDSWPAMNPESNDEEEANNALGVHARFFAKHLPRIKGRLARKMVALLGINQLREIPMAMYGPKEKEACGQALRFNSDVRTWWASLASGMPFNPKFDGEEKLEIERSVTNNGKDRYRYVRMHNKKNKLGDPGRKHWMRLWVQDGQGNAMGFDPFFDVMQYLKVTGQLRAKNRKVMQVDLDGQGKGKRTVDWMTLKTWVLGTKEEKVQICKTLGYKPMDLRSFCFSQMNKGRGEELYTIQRNAGKEASDDEE